jgi:hypothetical protein
MIHQNNIEKAVSTSSYTGIHVKAVIQTVGYKGADAAYVEYWNGTDWINLWSGKANGGWQIKDLVCSSDADNNPDFKVRFRSKGNKPEDLYYVDNVEVTGTQ